MGGAPNSTAAPENNFDFDAICACTSRPTTEFHFDLTILQADELWILRGFCHTLIGMKHLLFWFGYGSGKVFIEPEVDGLLHQFHVLLFADKIFHSK